MAFIFLSLKTPLKKVLSLLNKKTIVIKRAKIVQNTYIIGHLTRYFICNIFFYYNKACINMKIRHSIVITKLLPSRHKYHIVFIFFNIVTTWDYFFESCFTGECPCVAHCVGQGDLLQLWVERRPVWWAFPHSRQLHSWPQQVRICHILDSYIIDPNRWEFFHIRDSYILDPVPNRWEFATFRTATVHSSPPAGEINLEDVHNPVSSSRDHCRLYLFAL